MPRLDCPGRRPVSNFLLYFRFLAEEITRITLSINLGKKLSCSADIYFRYAMGGYDGNKMVSSTEIYDPRLNAWRMGDPMITPRGYAAAVNLNDSLFLIGGMQSNVQILDTVSDPAVIYEPLNDLSFHHVLCSQDNSSFTVGGSLQCKLWLVGTWFQFNWEEVLRICCCHLIVSEEHSVYMASNFVTSLPLQGMVGVTWGKLPLRSVLVMNSEK